MVISYVQVIPYDSHGCSVRVGRGIDSQITLLPKQCIYFDFAEQPWEIKEAINFIRRLPNQFRYKTEALSILKACLEFSVAGKMGDQKGFVERTTGLTLNDHYLPLTKEFRTTWNLK